jgi:hypothetical protein
MSDTERIRTMWRTFIKTKGSDQLTPVTVSGEYDSASDTFYYRKMDRGAMEVAVPNAGKDLAEAVSGGIMCATVVEARGAGFNQDPIYKVRFSGWNETIRDIDGWTAGSGLLNPGDVIHLPVNGHSPVADTVPTGTIG